jgi:hypothetical protein
MSGSPVRTNRGEPRNKKLNENNRAIDYVDIRVTHKRRPANSFAIITNNCQ